MPAIAVGHHLEDDRAFTAPGVTDRAQACAPHLLHIHAVHVLAGNSEREPALREIGCRRGTLYRGAHRVLVVLDDEDDRQLPKLRHVERLVDLALVRGTVAEIRETDPAVVPILVCEGKPCAERHRCADNAVAAVEAFVGRKHVHGTALAFGAAVAAPRQLRHDGFRFHTARQRVAVVAVCGDDLIARLERHLHADNNGFLSDVEVAEAADVTHAVELAGLFLEAADQQHLTICIEALLAGERRNRGRLLRTGCTALGARCTASGFVRSHPEVPTVASSCRWSRTLQEAMVDGQKTRLRRHEPMRAAQGSRAQGRVTT